jgi:flagellar basal-body rod protein FlgB
MLSNLTSNLDFQSKALLIRAERQRVIAGNIANADTPGFAARDLDFKAAMAEATGGGALQARASGGGAGSTTHAKHIPLTGSSGGLGDNRHLGYVAQTQPSLDGNSVDLDQERANFVDNAVRYEATLRFINGGAKTILSAIQGQ